METRRFILALSLSLLVFLGYVKYFAPKPPVQTPEQEAATQEAAKARGNRDGAPFRPPRVRCGKD